MDNESVISVEKNSYNMEENRIYKKQYLGNRTLKEFRIPPRVFVVEDWAFAHCKELFKIEIPKGVKTMGQNVFLGCEGLKEVLVYEEDFLYKEEAGLLALGIRFFPDDRLFCFENIGTEQWYEAYDKMLLAYLEQPDEEGFDPFLAGGEEDYEDPKNNRDFFCKWKQQRKCEVLLERFLHDSNLSEIYAQKYKNYLVCRREAWIQILQNKGEEALRYLNVCDRAGLIQKENIGFLLEAFEDSRYTECKAYLLRYQAKYLKKEAVWDGFAL